MGAQRLPVRFELRGAEAIARFAGRTVDREWRVLRARMVEFVERFGDAAEDAPSPAPITVAGQLRRFGRAILELDDLDFRRLLDVLEWLREHPDSGMRIRQLPVRGVDTKWIGRHRGLVTALHLAVTGRVDLGLVSSQELVRIRILDPALCLPGFAGLTDVTAPVAELAMVPFEPSRILVVENLETLLSLGPLPGTIAIFGAGFGAGRRVAALPWAMRTDAAVQYWGDLDSHGFAILDEFRASVPRAESILMDADDLARHLDLAVSDPASTPSSFTRLTESEEATLADLRSGGHLRLEQERVPWGYVESRLRFREFGSANP